MPAFIGDAVGHQVVGDIAHGLHAAIRRPAGQQTGNHVVSHRIVSQGKGLIGASR